MNECDPIGLDGKSAVYGPAALTVMLNKCELAGRTCSGVSTALAHNLGDQHDGDACPEGNPSISEKVSIWLVSDVVKYFTCLLEREVMLTSSYMKSGETATSARAITPVMYRYIFMTVRLKVAIIGSSLH